MSSDISDYYSCDTDADIGYEMIVDKHINIYEKIFDENERHFNRYKNIEAVLTVSDNESNVENKHIEHHVITITDSDYEEIVDSESESEQPKAQETQTTSDEIFNSTYIDPSLYKVVKHFDKCLYTCEWWSCLFVSFDYKAFELHLLNSHLETRVFDNYSRSFVEPNVYNYKCTHSSDCGYSTTTRESILSHVYEHSDRFKTCCLCDELFAKRRNREFICEDRRRSNVDNISKQDSSVGEKQNWCAFKQTDSEEYLSGNGVCSLRSIRLHYQKRLLCDGGVCRYHYSCRWYACEFETSKYVTIHQHIHDRHLCPNIVAQTL